MREKLLDEGTLLPSTGQTLKLKGDDEDAAMDMMHLLLDLASILKLSKFAERTRRCLKVLRETLMVKTKDLTGEHPTSRHIMQRMDKAYLAVMRNYGAGSQVRGPSMRVHICVYIHMGPAPQARSSSPALQGYGPAMLALCGVHVRFLLW